MMTDQMGSSGMFGMGFGMIIVLIAVFALGIAVGYAARGRR